eukprot:Nk52_evm1s706 gene=Nk52_evmTU1s706
MIQEGSSTAFSFPEFTLETLWKTCGRPVTMAIALAPKRSSFSEEQLSFCPLNVLSQCPYRDKDPSTFGNGSAVGPPVGKLMNVYHSQEHFLLQGLMNHTGEGLRSEFVLLDLFLFIFIYAASFLISCIIVWGLFLYLIGSPVDELSEKDWNNRLCRMATLSCRNNKDAKQHADFIVDSLLCLGKNWENVESEEGFNIFL